MRRLFIEVQYDQELVEVSGIHCSGSEFLSRLLCFKFYLSRKNDFNTSSAFSDEIIFLVTSSCFPEILVRSQSFYHLYNFRLLWSRLEKIPLLAPPIDHA